MKGFFPVEGQHVFRPPRVVVRLGFFFVSCLKGQHGHVLVRWRRTRDCLSGTACGRQRSAFAVPPWWTTMQTWWLVAQERALPTALNSSRRCVTQPQETFLLCNYPAPLPFRVSPTADETGGWPDDRFPTLQRK